MFASPQAAGNLPLEIKTDILIMIDITLLLISKILDETLCRVDGIILFSGVILQTVCILYIVKKKVFKLMNR